MDRAEIRRRGIKVERRNDADRAVVDEVAKEAAQVSGLHIGRRIPGNEANPGLPPTAGQ